MSAEKEKSVSAGNRDAQRDEANVTHGFSVKTLRQCFDSELAENIGTLFIAAIIWFATFI
jgi:hypothetical protein